MFLLEFDISKDCGHSNASPTDDQETKTRPAFNHFTRRADFKMYSERRCEPRLHNNLHFVAQKRRDWCTGEFLPHRLCMSSIKTQRAAAGTATRAKLVVNLVRATYRYCTDRTSPAERTPDVQLPYKIRNEGCTMTSLEERDEKRVPCLGPGLKIHIDTDLNRWCVPVSESRVHERYGED